MQPAKFRPGEQCEVTSIANPGAGWFECVVLEARETLEGWRYLIDILDQPAPKGEKWYVREQFLRKKPGARYDGWDRATWVNGPWKPRGKA